MQQMMSNWLEANINANLFIKNKDYSVKKKALANLKVIRELNQEIAQIQKKTGGSFDINPLTNQLRSTFDQAVQSNRIYLSLVNVVLAGDASEFTTLAQKLRIRTLNSLAELKTQNEKNTKKNRNMIYIVLTLSVPILLLIF